MVTPSTGCQSIKGHNHTHFLMCVEILMMLVSLQSFEEEVFYKYLRRKPQQCLKGENPNSVFEEETQ